MRRDEYDLLVQGGGMIGLATALAAADGGARVALLDREPPRPWQGGEVRQRVSALNLASERLLTGLGVWPEILAERAGRFEAIHAEDAASEARVRFEAADAGLAHLGHIVENELVCAMLAARAPQAGVSRLAPGAIAEWTPEAEGLDVRLEDGRRLRTRLLVGADGAGSAVRTRAGIHARVAPYGQEAVVANVTTGARHGHAARQRFLEGGPLAFLPLADGRCSIVWSLPADEAEVTAGLSDAAFTTLLDEAGGSLVGGIESVGPRARFPLRRLHAERYIDERVALVGDAAHVIHPLAGQGANLGFRDAATLAEGVVTALAAGRDPGGRGLLRRYERARRGDNHAMQLAMDAFHAAFTRHDPLLVRLRGAGFGTADRVPPLRRAFMRAATGLAGELPALMRTPGVAA
ncbi:2-octaprenylphenol hydroxylase [wastewater metagenome]|uniref:2-octaprenylphenol hydroxylase n=2 Tax=unclassified sequences TaxID=12908 RepID=A0A5B8RBZ8_9ZZZZ|nr:MULTISPECIES: UbiH/UbiF/VisC/COQ6 family ubiquinone biosynthesis hydroxylase [Arhodomonas]MCS4502950.1 UbiH/UbiF/VisC/COQ6 family ubiquinone biosynthesis hydroxylase [Arhodomonas aquaeolei]QEA06181.1 2-octaprenylphenol hydroxylase [uncultured organism]